MHQLTIQAFSENVKNNFYVQQFINLDVEAVSLNTEKADHLSCSQCKEQIPRLNYLTKGRTVICRDNRVDCEGDRGLESYHLDCYDLLLVGHITKATKEKIICLQRIYGELSISHGSTQEGGSRSV